MGQVDAQAMTASATDVAGAFVWAYRQLKGFDPPTRETWLYPTALSAIETAHWQSFYNFNLGNVTTNGITDWYYNPHVTNGLKFISYGSLGEGALGELKTLQHLGGLQAAENSDQGAFQTSLNAYLGSTYPDLSGTIRSLAGVNPSNWSPSPLGALGTLVRPVLIAGSLLFLASLAANYFQPGTVTLPKIQRALRI